MSSDGTIVLRVRTQVGTWRLQGVKATDSIADVIQRICAEHHTELLPDKPISRDARGLLPMEMSDTISSLGLKNGDMIYVTVNEGEARRRRKHNTSLLLDLT